ncbi:hypothetical protein, partial [Terrabacter sp. NPDC080008]|uniref:hypothetical protein n=1 Tax=Terrabacter sp. NPDC080008 TaxID=3155176 RepID=UPI0034502797
CQEQAEMVWGPAALFHMLLLTRWPELVQDPLDEELVHCTGQLVDVGVVVVGAGVVVVGAGVVVVVVGAGVVVVDVTGTEVVVDGADEVVVGADVVDVVVVVGEVVVDVVDVVLVGVVVPDVVGGGVVVGGQCLHRFPWQLLLLDTSCVVESADADDWVNTNPTRVTRSPTRAAMMPDRRIVTMDLFSLLYPPPQHPSDARGGRCKSRIAPKRGPAGRRAAREPHQKKVGRICTNSDPARSPDSRCRLAARHLTVC